MIDNINMSEFEGFSEEEKEAVLRILREYSEKGNSETYKKLVLSDYKEEPVDIITFIKDSRYLGKAWHDSNGKCKLFPYWENMLKQLFPTPYDTAVNNFIESGARGLGKSEIAVTCALYLMYRVMCLKDPHVYFNLKPTEQIAFAFMNITETLAYDIGVTKFQNTVQLSPWFMQRGTLSGKKEVIWNPPDYINIIVGSQPRHVIGQAILYAFFDEISFIANQDVEKQKAKAIDMIDTALGGMKTRFTNRGKNPSLMILASSKRSEKSFLETHMKQKLKSEGENTLIVDEPVWNVRPPSEYSGKRFKIALGNKFLVSEVIPEDSDVNVYINKGYQIIDVPVEYKANFTDDIERALCDYAGISSSDITKYISGPRLLQAKHKEIVNPFVKDIITVGNDPNDTTQYSDFFDLTRIPSKLRYKPLYIHFDMSITGDRTGIGGTFIIGKKPGLSQDVNSKELYFQVAFYVAVQAPKGWQVSFAKNREFVYWLKEQGFNIKGISSDTFQNASLAQDFISKGFKYEIISVDRVNSEHVCEPYFFFKNALYDGRMLLPEDCSLLTRELVGLERNINTGKIDHTDGGRVGCFTGDTKVKLVDGRDLTFLELVDEYSSGKTNWVYSFNEKTKRIEPKRIEKAWCTLHNQPLLEVELDNGEKIRCTYNHRFMLRDGSYQEAQYLVEGQSLMPLYTKYPGRGLTNYRMYYEPIENKWHYEHRQFAVEVLDERYLVHHKNCNPDDNTPDNLMWMSRKAHQNMHAQIQTGAQSPEAKLKRAQSLVKWHEEARGTDAYNKRNKKLSESLLSKTPIGIREARASEAAMRAQVQQQHHEHAEEQRKIYEERIKELEKLYDVNWQDLSHIEKNAYGNMYTRSINPQVLVNISNTLSKRHQEGLFLNAYEALNKSNAESKKLKEMCPTVDKQKFYDIFGVQYDDLPKGQKAPFTTKYRKIVCQDITNHKVVKITALDQKEDVYDIQVEDNHNFALASGVFVHNSKDAADAICGSLWNASKHADEFNFEYGETLDTIIDTDKLDVNDERNQVTVDFEEMLKQTFDTMQQVTHKNVEHDKQHFVDFGLGKATSAFNMSYLSDGIII